MNSKQSEIVSAGGSTSRSAAGSVQDSLASNNSIAVSPRSTLGEPDAHSGALAAPDAESTAMATLSTPAASGDSPLQRKVSRRVGLGCAWLGRGTHSRTRLARSLPHPLTNIHTEIGPASDGDGHATRHSSRKPVKAAWSGFCVTAVNIICNIFIHAPDTSGLAGIAYGRACLHPEYSRYPFVVQTVFDEYIPHMLLATDCTHTGSCWRS